MDNGTDEQNQSLVNPKQEKKPPEYVRLMRGLFTQVFTEDLHVYCISSSLITAVLRSNYPSSGRQEKIPQLLPHRPVRQRSEPGCGQVSQPLQLDSRGDPHTRCAEVLRGQFLQIPVLLILFVEEVFLISV